MNRRIRKKKKVGEFIQYGFLVNFNTSRTDAEVDELIDGMIQLCEANNLAMGGGGSLKVEGVPSEFEFGFSGVKPRQTRRGTYYRSRSCVEAERTLLREWLSGRVENLVVGPLVDFYH